MVIYRLLIPEHRGSSVSIEDRRGRTCTGVIPEIASALSRSLLSPLSLPIFSNSFLLPSPWPVFSTFVCLSVSKRTKAERAAPTHFGFRASEPGYGGRPIVPFWDDRSQHDRHLVSAETILAIRTVGHRRLRRFGWQPRQPPRSFSQGSRFLCFDRPRIYFLDESKPGMNALRTCGRQQHSFQIRSPFCLATDPAR